MNLIEFLHWLCDDPSGNRALMFCVIVGVAAWAIAKVIRSIRK